MLAKSEKQKMINDLIDQDDIRTIIDIKSFSIHTKKPVAHRTLDRIAENTNTHWVGFCNKPDYLFIAQDKL